MTNISLDTNVLIYNHLRNNEYKRTIARKLLTLSPVISTQVVSEYINVMKRLLPIPKADILKLCAQWMQECTIKMVAQHTILLSEKLVRKYDFQIFDAIIIASALEADCDILYSEDFQNGMKLEQQLTIINPFL
jgi:predicted nucleic acid-binding protein